MSAAATPASAPVYQLKVTLRDISPLVWRRLLVTSETTIAQLHDVVQIAMGWEDLHLHQFRIHGKAYGIYRTGGLSFADDPHHVVLAAFRLRTGERFVYEYDMGDFWQHDLRLEQVVPREPRRQYPACIAGSGDCPPEDCGGPGGYMRLLEERCSWSALDAAREDLALVAQRLLDWSAGGPRPTYDDDTFSAALDRMHERRENAPITFNRRTVNALLRKKDREREGEAMHVRIQLVTVADDGAEHLQEIADLARGEVKIETVGLTLEESKRMLYTLQQAIIGQQVTAYLVQQRACPSCGKARRLKGSVSAPFRTLFGVVPVPNPQWHQCPCQPHTTKTVRPLTVLLPTRTSPELLYLETKWAALVSYGLTAKILHDVLPINLTHSAVTVRNHTLQTARRKEQLLGDEKVMFVDGCQAERDRLSLPDGPLSVGLDGAIVRARRGACGEKTANLFEVIAGKSILAFRRDDPDDVPPSSTCFALVRRVDTTPKRRLFEVLQSQGMQANQQITFFSDGGDTVRTLPEYLHPEAEHILDWFHIVRQEAA